MPEKTGQFQQVVCQNTVDSNIDCVLPVRGNIIWFMNLNVIGSAADWTAVNVKLSRSLTYPHPEAISSL